MKQKLEVKPMLESLFEDKEAWKNWQSLQKQRRKENLKKIQAFISAGLKNPWLNRSVDIDDGDFVCEDFLEINSFCILESLEQLKAELNYSNWSINSAFIYNDLAFINQISGGREWAVFKYNQSKNTAFAFESWTGFCVDFDEFHKIEKATDEQLRKLEW